MPSFHFHNKPRSGTTNRSVQRNTASQDTRCDRSSSEKTITEKMIADRCGRPGSEDITYRRDCYGSDANMNDDSTFEAGNDTELLCTRVSLLLKVMVSKNYCNATRKILQDFLVQSQQSDWHVAFPLWYSSNTNSSASPIEQTDVVSHNFQSLQTYSPCLNPNKHTKQQQVHTSIFFCHSNELTQLQKDMRFWFENFGHKLYKNPLQC